MSQSFNSFNHSYDNTQFSIKNGSKESIHKQSLEINHQSNTQLSQTDLSNQTDSIKCKIEGASKSYQYLQGQPERIEEEDENIGGSKRNIFNDNQMGQDYYMKNPQNIDNSIFENLTVEQQDELYGKPFDNFCLLLSSFLLRQSLQEKADNIEQFYGAVMREYRGLYENRWPRRYQVFIIIGCFCDDKKVQEKKDWLSKAERDLEEVGLEEDKDAGYWTRIMYYKQADLCFRSKDECKELLRIGRSIGSGYFEDKPSKLDEMYCGIRAKMYNEGKRMEKARKCSKEAIAFGKRVSEFNGGDIKHPFCFGWKKLEKELKAILKNTI